MGTYDKVEFEAYCPRCGTKISEFQTKDGDQILSTIKTDDCDEWYNECPNCNLWLQFRHIHPSECRPKFDEMAFIALNYLKK